MRPSDDEKTATELGEEIRRMRIGKSWTLRQLAEASGLDFGYVGKIERGEVAPIATYRRLVEALGARLDVTIVMNARRAAPRRAAACDVHDHG